MAGVIVFLCLIFGGYATVRSITNGARRVGARLCPKEDVHATGTGAGGAEQLAGSQNHTQNQRCIEDLKALFALYQAGVLTKEEFETVKGQLLSKMKAYA